MKRGTASKVTRGGNSEKPFMPSTDLLVQPSEWARFKVLLHGKIHGSTYNGGRVGNGTVLKSGLTADPPYRGILSLEID